MKKHMQTILILIIFVVMVIVISSCKSKDNNDIPNTYKNILKLKSFCESKNTDICGFSGDNFCTLKDTNINSYIIILRNKEIPCGLRFTCIDNNSLEIREYAVKQGCQNV